VKVQRTGLPDVLVIEPRVFADARGAFFEGWQRGRYAEHLGDLPFVQDSVSVSRRGVLRGLHLQHPFGQGKLVSVLSGEAFDVAVDVRRGSPTFGRWVGETLSAANHRQLWIPPGFAHGFQALTDDVAFLYKCTEIYHPEAELTVRWSDPDIGIAWPLSDAIVSPRDAAAPLLREVPAERLPPG